MDMPPGTTFAVGVAKDEPGSLNMARTGKKIKWVAKRGEGMHDWAIYCYFNEPVEVTMGYVTSWGDKVFSEEHIKMLVPCDDEAYSLYRRQYA